MFAERQYWQDVADRFVKENVTVKPNRGNIISSDGKLMASSLPEYRIYMDFMSGKKDEKRSGRKIRHRRGFHPQCQYGFNLYWTSEDIPRTRVRLNSRHTSRKDARQKAAII